MPTWVRNNALSIVLFGLFAVFLVGQSLTGWRTYNSDQREHGEPTVDYGSYLTTGHFVEATFENWESEFLQMGAYVVLTVWLVQKGSSESKPPDGRPAAGCRPTDAARRRGRSRAGPRGRVATDAVRELPGHRVRGVVPAVDDPARPRGSARVQRRAGGARRIAR